MSERKPVYSLSISGRLTLEMHALNNEGGEGNQVLTRVVTLVEPNGTVHKVNAISGDMFKHIQAEHYYLLAKENGLNLCKGCQQFSAERIVSDDEFITNWVKKQKKVKVGGKDKKVWEYSDEEVIDALLQRCALDDTEGTLIAPKQSGGSSRSIPRKSVAEFAWVVGIPERVRTESYFHVRYAQERGGEEGVSQPIFHRPASSGVYASVATFEVARIGFNDISQTYALDEGERLRRYAAFLKSVLYTYVEPSGAMRGTQNPHIVAFEGVVTVSYGVLPAPTVSPLAKAYADQVEAIARALDPEAATLAVHRFDDMATFAAIMRDLIATTRPYRLFDRADQEA